ncbi:sulfur carrier protein ThiS [Aquitalea sp. ASV15]|uniref:sulfur carrier protein ThiS n=1 Tax=Aquitalea sp. ASV15 TaxID=2795104 RepID=UPI0018EAD56B|nr:sulfur carrier protein ThiS [Aquitalea sp. ASV15]
MHTIHVNGAATTLDKPMTVTQLLEQLELQGRRVAIERNGFILTRSRYGETVLDHGDHLEIIIAVGGG